MAQLKRDFLISLHGVRDRITRVIGSGKMRRILCNPHRLDFSRVLDNGYILIISLAQLPPELARMIGATLFRGLQATIFERSEEEAKECAIYVDEFQDYIRSHDSAEMFRRLFRQGRRHKVSFTVAHLDFSFMDDDLLGAVHGNPSVHIAFSCGDTEASKMSRIFGDPSLWTGILKSDDHKAWIRIANEVQIIETYPPPKKLRDLPKFVYDKPDPPSAVDLSPKSTPGEDATMEIHEPEPTYKDATTERLRELRKQYGGGRNNKQSPDPPKKKTRPRKRV